jgi:uncharacterized SAM-binding protein YcdF (DUF218 family)
MAPGRIWLLVALMVACSAAGLYAGRDRLLSTLGEWLDVGGRPAKADYVMVLGGDCEMRPPLAARLYATGLAGGVLVPTSQACADVRNDPMCQALLREGVSEQAIVVLDRRVASTRDEASALEDFLALHPGSRVSVVTNHYHTRRAKWIFDQVLGSQAHNVFFVSAAAKGFDLANWWKSDRGTGTILLEYRKLGYYFVRYGLGPAATAAGSAGLLGILTVLGLHRRRRPLGSRPAATGDLRPVLRGLGSPIAAAR